MSQTSEFNVALTGLVKDRGNAVKHLATLLGETEDDVRERIKWAEYDDGGDEDSVGLSASDKRYLARLYGRSKDPKVRRFMLRVRSGGPPADSVRATAASG